LLLLRNKDQEYNNPLASFATSLCWQRIGHERTVQLRWAFRGLAVTTLPWSTSLCSGCCKKRTVFSPGNFLLFFTK